MIMFNLGFLIGGGLIAVVAVVRGRQGLAFYRSGALRAWFKTELGIDREFAPALDTVAAAQ